VSQPTDEFVHHYAPARPGAALPGVTLLLLHGTGGDERDLVPLAATVSPGTAVLSPRGRVLEGSMPRFFRRLAEGVFDVPDLVARTHELAAFIDDAAVLYGFDRRRVVALGFSNGANIAASLLLLHPGALAGAVLLRAMVPFAPDPDVRLPGTPVLVSAGRADPLIPAADSQRLAAMLQDAGARVSLAVQPGGHQLAQGDVLEARRWLAEGFGPGAGTSAGGVDMSH
jgi:predicted esterase